jgi:hypothetical protein
MNDDSIAIIRCEPALRYLEANPDTDSRHAAARFHCPAEMVEAFLRKYGPMRPGLVDQAKKAAGAIAVMRIPQNEKPAEAKASIPNMKYPFQDLPRKPFAVTISRFRPRLEAMAAGGPRQGNEVAWLSRLDNWFGVRNPSAEAVKEFLKWLGPVTAGNERLPAAASAGLEATNAPRIEAPTIVHLIVEIDVRVKCSTVN